MPVRVSKEHSEDLGWFDYRISIPLFDNERLLKFALKNNKSPNQVIKDEIDTLLEDIN